METYLIYIGKAAIASGAFYLAFLILFQNQKHFRFNRIYLPVSLAISFVIPLITFSMIKYIEPVEFDLNSLASLANSETTIEKPVVGLQWYQYLTGLYVTGIAGFLFHLILGYLKAVSIVKQSWIKNLFQVEVNITKQDVHPFSFFNKIVLSEKTLVHPNLKMIISHENIHVKEKHTLDILISESLFLLQWFNPFAWLIKDAIKNNLEYKTDHQIVENYNPQAYQLAMVGLADKKGVAPFLNALNGSQLKKRIIMMKKKTENKHALLKQLVVLPLLAILVMGLSNKEVKTEIIQSENRVEKISRDLETSQITDKDFPASNSLSDNVDRKVYGEKGKTDVIIATTRGDEVISSELEFRKFIAGKAKYPMSAQENNIRGKIKIYATISSKGTVTNVTDIQPKEFQILDEVVITGLGPENNSEAKVDNQSEVLTSEAKRVIKMLPEIEIPELKGKTVEITIEFTLQ